MRCALVTLLLCACAASPPAAPPSLPMQTRDALGARMQRHGGEMRALMTSVVALEYEKAELLAGAIAAEPRLSRLSHDTLNAELPEGFFTYQDTLADRARALESAARGRDDAQLGKAFGALAESCVACHAAYRPR